MTNSILATEQEATKQMKQQIHITHIIIDIYFRFDRGEMEMQINLRFCKWNV